MRALTPRGRLAAGDDSGVAMVISLITILITAMMSLVLLGVMMSQMMPTSFLRASSKTVFAAEAGANAVIGQIRTAAAAPDVTGAVYGSRAKLPCTASGPVEVAGGTLTYAATVRYYVLSPEGRTDAWLAANALGCTPGSGPSADPGYAVITAEGLGPDVVGMGADAGDRTVQVIYEFQITNNNIPGGLIYSFDPAQVPDRFCLEAYSATVGSTIRYVPTADCGSNEVHQLWIYDTDYTIKLASSTVPAPGVVPLCITGPSGGAAPQRATLQACLAKTDPARWNQLWSWEGGARWRGQRDPISSGYSSLLLSSGTASGSPAGRDLWVTTSAASNAEWGSFNPDARVGAGAAGIDTRQIVNYLEFGRCFDVTNESVTYSHMIVYPCKQDPIPGGPNLLWNHKWYYSEPAGNLGALGPQQIFVMQYNTTKYCLVSPGTEGGYVVLTSSCNSAAANQQWTRTGNTGSYSTSYTFVDHWGRCAALGDKFLGAFSKITTATCNGGLAQKWNAPPNTIEASVEGYQELP